MLLSICLTLCCQPISIQLLPSQPDPHRTHICPHTAPTSAPRRTMLLAFIHSDCSVVWHNFPCCVASIFLSNCFTRAKLCECVRVGWRVLQGVRRREGDCGARRCKSYELVTNLPLTCGSTPPSELCSGRPRHNACASPS